MEAPQTSLKSRDLGYSHMIESSSFFFFYAAVEVLVTVTISGRVTVFLNIFFLFFFLDISFYV